MSGTKHMCGQHLLNANQHSVETCTMHSIISVQSPWIEIALFNRAFWEKGAVFFVFPFSHSGLDVECWNHLLNSEPVYE